MLNTIRHLASPPKPFFQRKPPFLLFNVPAYKPPSSSRISVQHADLLSRFLGTQQGKSVKRVKLFEVQRKQGTAHALAECTQEKIVTD